jgi:sigma54-dependent transcription regulator
MTGMLTLQDPWMWEEVYSYWKLNRRTYQVHSQAQEDVGHTVKAELCQWSY